MSGSDGKTATRAGARTSGPAARPADPADVPAITFDRVSVHYGPRRRATATLVDFNLRVRAGETVALLGPSGSGKSTALSALAGFVRPTSGAVRLAGVDVTGLPPARRGIGVVLQSYALFPHMTVADNVAFGLRARRLGRREVTDRVGDALAMVGMSAFGARLPRELSGGQQQRVAIARALAIRPPVLLLDEPLAALDARLRLSMLGELRRLREALPDTAMLYVTHDQSEALALADRIAVMNDARLVDVDTAENLWKRPPTGFTASFLGGANLIPCTVGRVIGTSALVTVGPRILAAEAPPPAAGAPRWDPESAALLCIRPHALRMVSLGERDAMRATVRHCTWRGAVTRLQVSLGAVSDQPVDVDVPGHVEAAVGSEVGIRFPEPAGVLVALP